MEQTPPHLPNPEGGGQQTTAMELVRFLYEGYLTPPKILKYV